MGECIGRPTSPGGLGRTLLPTDSGASPLSLVAVLLNSVTPVDIVPDSLGAIDFVDNVAVIEAAIEAVRTELNRFRAWEEINALPAQ